MIVAIVIIAAVIIAIVIAARVAAKRRSGNGSTAAAVQREKYIADEPELDVELLPINPYSRPGIALEEVNGIVIHYTANPGTTALQNRNYFANLAETQETSASSHFIVGLGGEIVQCIPCSEIAYASGERNSDTISIECCIEDDTGRFNSKTYDSLIKLTTWLMGRYELDTSDVIRHYDVSGKNCPKYYVENPGAWTLFKSDLEDYIEKYGIYREDES
ncbi:MAG: peptidoglycan recognition protein family protein [Clostridiales bacterium]|nr:peptidoglycan recognition protein family protein [Clostridiales bacterium]